MTQPGGRQLAHMWAVMTSAFASAAADVRAEGHLATDAVVAFVDGELSLSAHQRATRHLAHCSLCAAEVAAQRQASTAVRDADPPAVPKSLLDVLHNIPLSASLPPGPEELAVSEDGQLVVVQRPSDGRVGSRAPLGIAPVPGSSRRLGSTGLGTGPAGSSPAGTGPAADRSNSGGLGGPGGPGGLGSPGGRRRTGRLAQGAGVVVSGLVVGVLVLAAPTEPPGVPAGPGPLRPGGVGGAQLPVDAELAPREQTGSEPAAWPDRPSAPSMLVR